METQVVKFYGDDLPVKMIENRAYVAVRSMANAIGLHADSALTGVKNDEILGQLLVDDHVVAGDNKQRLMQLLPIDHVVGWLFSIDISKVKEEIKPKLVLYKRECYKVLNDHFFGKNKVVTDSQKELAYIYTRIKEIDRSIKDGLMERRQLVQRKSIIECENFRQLGIQFENFDTAEVVEDEIKGFLNKN